MMVVTETRRRDCFMVISEFKAERETRRRMIRILSSCSDEGGYYKIALMYEVSHRVSTIVFLKKRTLNLCVIQVYHQ